MKRATRKWMQSYFGGGSVYEGDARDVLDSDARQRAELRRLRAFVRERATYTCMCGDGDVCVGCQARAVLKRRKP